MKYEVLMPATFSTPVRYIYDRVPNFVNPQLVVLDPLCERNRESIACIKKYKLYILPTEVFTSVNIFNCLEDR